MIHSAMFRETDNGRRTMLFGKEYQWWFEDGRWSLVPVSGGDND